jgi:membrane associated rhomboid family serine protease
VFFPIRDYRPSGSFPIVTVTIIIIDVLIYLYQALVLGSQPSPYWIRSGFHRESLSMEQLFIFTYGLQPCEVLRNCRPFPPTSFPIWITLFTSMFLHGSVLHVAGNMWYLWIFGDNVEDAMGRVRFLAFYLLSGLAAAAAQILSSPDSPIPMIGASGAIAGVLGAYMMLYPYGRVLTLVWFFYFVRFVQMPAIFVLGLWFVIQVLSASLGGGSLEGGGVAWMAHIGGFLAGALLVRFFAIRPAGNIGR